MYRTPYRTADHDPFSKGLPVTLVRRRDRRQVADRRRQLRGGGRRAGDQPAHENVSGRADPDDAREDAKGGKIGYCH